MQSNPQEARKRTACGHRDEPRFEKVARVLLNRRARSNGIRSQTELDGYPSSSKWSRRFGEPGCGFKIDQRRQHFMHMRMISIEPARLFFAQQFGIDQLALDRHQGQ